LALLDGRRRTLDALTEATKSAGLIGTDVIYPRRAVHGSLVGLLQFGYTQKDPRESIWWITDSGKQFAISQGLGKSEQGGTETARVAGL